MGTSANKKFWGSVACAAALIAVFCGSLASQVAQANAKAYAAVTSVADVPVPKVPNVTPTGANGVATAADWSKAYPDIYASHMANADNTGHEGGRIKYTEQDPAIQTLYQGMGFSFDYTEAIGHAYTLQDIAETTRPHKLANCLTCKTPDLTALVNAQGTGVYAMDFEEVMAQMSETVSCYNCHGNTPGTIVIESDYMKNAMQDEIDAGTVDAVNVSCGQCHIEYYFDPETKATLTPYDTPEGMAPDAILAYYNEMGFTDYTNENSGTQQIKVQHPEFETYTGAGSVHAGTFNCADCHMGVAYNSKGVPYVNHEFTSPLDNQHLLDTTCAQCHSDLAGMVHGIQDEITARETEVSQLLLEVNEKLAAAVTAGEMSEDELNEIRALDRDAQFYWDFVYVENSEGAHNSTLARECLDKAEALANEALAKF